MCGAVKIRHTSNLISSIRSANVHLAYANCNPDFYCDTKEKINKREESKTMNEKCGLFKDLVEFFLRIFIDMLVELTIYWKEKYVPRPIWNHIAQDIRLYEPRERYFDISHTLTQTHKHKQKPFTLIQSIDVHN